MSKSESSSAAGGGISVFGLLGVAFVVMKLCGVIAWSWWWVTLPFWGVMAFIVAVLAFCGFGLAVVWVVGKLTN